MSGVRVFGRDLTMGRAGRVWDVFCSCRVVLAVEQSSSHQWVPSGCGANLWG